MLYLGHNGGNLKFLYRNFHFGKSKTYFGKINLQKSQYCAGRMYFCPQNRWKNVLTITYCFLTSENLHTFRKPILLSTCLLAKKLSVQYKPPFYKPTICQVHNPHIHIQVSNWYFLKKICTLRLTLDLMNVRLLFQVLLPSSVTDLLIDLGKQILKVCSIHFKHLNCLILNERLQVATLKMQFFQFKPNKTYY